MADTRQQADAHELVLTGDHEGAMPAPWVFDGTRRMYTDGRPESWIARAVDPSGSIGSRIAMQTGEGATPIEAVIDLIERLAK